MPRLLGLTDISVRISLYGYLCTARASCLFTVMCIISSSTNLLKLVCANHVLPTSKHGGGRQRLSYLQQKFQPVSWFLLVGAGSASSAAAHSNSRRQNRTRFLAYSIYLHTRRRYRGPLEPKTTTKGVGVVPGVLNHDCKIFTVPCVRYWGNPSWFAMGAA